MKRIVLALLVLVPLAASAASLEESYFAARDRYAEKFAAVTDFNDSVYTEHDAAMQELEAQLVKIIGPSAIDGLPAPPKISLDTLFRDDEGFGLLDGLVYEAPGEKTTVTVTTAALLAHWLAEHRDWWESDPMPQAVEAALTSEIFYTQATSTDSAVARYAAIPIAKPAGAKFAYAMLAVHEQDLGPWTPDRIFVSIETEKRLFIIRAETKIDPIPACQPVWDAYKQKMDAAIDAYAASGSEDQKLFDQSTHLEEEGDVAFRSCYGERAKNAAFFPALVKQTQALVDALPVR